jgi:hypothetical protein
MKTKLSLLAALFCSFNLQAYSNFIENPYTPYPPGCATLPERQTALYGDNVVKVFDDQVNLSSATDPRADLPANLAIYRVACAEENRSLILFEFAIPDDLDPASTYYLVPDVVLQFLVDGYDFGGSMHLRPETNSWGGGDVAGSGEVFGGNTPGTTDGHDRRWIYVLDNVPKGGAKEFPDLISAWGYNSDVNLWVRTDHHRASTYLQIDSTDSLLRANPGIPLSGRLSGNWVVEGAADQGFVISISEVVPVSVPEPNDLPRSPLLMFLSWYTYDADGDKLWLTGSSQFAMGETEVTIPIEKVTHGQFMGSKTADRQVVGSVTITGNNCNDLSFQYDLSNIGLGSGTEHLERRYSLETAGYVCRDLEARMATR